MNCTLPKAGAVVPDAGATVAVRVTAVPYTGVAFEVLTVVVVAVGKVPLVMFAVVVNCGVGNA